MGTGLTEEYFRMLEENKNFFKKAFEIAEKIAEKVEKLLGDCEVYVTGSFARGEHTLSSDLDILIVSPNIPEKMSFRQYVNIVEKLTDDTRVNIHLANKNKFTELRKLYSPRVKVKTPRNTCSENRNTTY